MNARQRLGYLMVPGLLDLDTAHANICLQALRAIDRTLGFLDVTAYEYAEASASFAKARAHSDDALRTHRHEQEAFRDLGRVAELVHLRIETFYLFARILLDDIVKAVDTLIGTKGVMIGSHSAIETNLPRLVESRGGVPPIRQGLTELAIEANHRITTYRDKNVAHPALAVAGTNKGTIWGPGLGPAITVQTVSPKAGMSAHLRDSEPIAELRELVERYVIEWVEYLTIALPAATREGFVPPGL